MNYINKITIDTTETISELCQLMALNKTDKSPLVSPLLGKLQNDERVHMFMTGGHGFPVLAYAHAYTGVYNFLLSPFKNKKIKIAEIGVQYNNSIRGWRQWFPNAEIHGFEWVESFLDQAKSENLPNVSYHYINVYDKESIHHAMNEAGGGFDIIIEDSCHVIETQVNVINTIHPYLNTGGILIVEDIYPAFKNKPNEFGYFDYIEQDFAKAIEPVKQHYSNMIFVNATHKYKYTGLYGDVRMLVLYK